MRFNGRPSGAHFVTCLQSVSLRQLRFFAELAEGANFSAALRAHLAVPPVARQLAAIKMRSTEPIEATLCDGKSDALLDHLRSGVLDLVVGVHPVDDRTLESIALMEDELVEPRIVRRQVLLSRRRLMVEYPAGAKFAR